MYSLVEPLIIYYIYREVKIQYNKSNLCNSESISRHLWSLWAEQVASMW